MTVHNTTRAPSGIGAFVYTAFGVAAHTITSVWRTAEDLYARVQYRRGIREMLELDDHLLCDMGITRGDVLRASNLPLRESAGAELKRISQTRLLR